jgi:hypothetical protein
MTEISRGFPPFLLRWAISVSLQLQLYNSLLRKLHNTERDPELDHRNFRYQLIVNSAVQNFPVVEPEGSSPFS